MTPEQHQALQRLARCRILPGSWDKRFIRGLASMPVEHVLTARQAEVLDKLTHKYRRQLGSKNA
jgi:hypothetical protein